MDNNQEKNLNEIDLIVIINFYLRNKKIIFFGTLLSIFSSALISLGIPKTWKGEFQIVLQKNKQGNSNQLPNDLPSSAARFFKRADAADINTQITILKSPSVLMPIFDFVKDEKSKQGLDVDNWIFKDWKKDFLSVELEKGTKVLNLSYQDEDKNIIIPTLELISKTYQSYSGNQRQQNLRLTVTYLDKQIDDYQQKNKLSQRNLVEYSLKNDLELPEILNNKLNSSSDLARSENINRLKLIDQQIISLKNLKDEKEILKFISIISQSLNDQGISKYISIIESLNERTNSKASIFKDSYLEKDKRLLKKNIEVLKKEILKSLLARKEFIKDKLEAIKRPLEKIIKQRDLLLNAKLELKTIENLQSVRRIVSLEEKKVLPPWELITKPTLLESPVKPSKKKITLIGGFIGLIIFSLFNYLKELKLNLIYDEETFARKTGKNLLISLNKSTDNVIKLYFENLNEENIKNKMKYGLMLVGFLDQKNLEKLNFYIDNYSSGKSIIVEESFNNINDFDELILVSSLGKVSITQLEEISQVIKIADIKIAGFITI